MAQSRKIARFRSGFFFLVGLPFAAVGGLATWWSWHAMAEADKLRSWVEITAIITHAELKVTPARHRAGGRHRQDSGPTFRAIARYEYDFGGRRFTGDRVSLDGSSDNIGSFQRNAYRELQRHFIQKKPFRCFVNPQRPSDAILYRQLRWEMAAFYTVFATVFGAVGFGLLTGVLVSAWRAPKTRSANAAAEAPWLARTDWATGRIRESGGSAVALPVLAVLVVWWTIASLPLMRKLPAIFESAGGAWAVTTLIFPAVGTVLLLAFVYQLIRRFKFGPSVLELASTPGVVGGQLAGVVRIPRMVRPAEGFRLKLSCVEKSSRGKEAASEEVLWHNERPVTEPMCDRLSQAMAVPVLFAIPYEAEPTSLAEQDRHIEWRLDVSAETPGVDYKSRFEVPVFKTPESRTDFQFDERLAAESATAPRHDTLFRDAGIRKEPLPGAGVRLEFAAARNREFAIPLTVITLLWSGAILLMLRAGAWVVLPIVFGLIDVLLICGTARAWLYRSVVEARPDGLMLRGGLLGIGRRRFLALDQVKKIATSHSMSVNNKVWNNIVVVLHDEKERTIARSIEGRFTQRAVIDELNAALGRRQEKRTRRSKIEETP